MNPSIVITGISSGLGKAIAQYLSNSYQVIGTVRNTNQADLEALRSMGVKILPLDISKTESIQSFTRALSDYLMGQKLKALVNNAGIVTPSAVLTTPVEKIRYHYEVNLFGVYDLTASLIPLIQQPGGKILNIGSISSRFTTPFIAPYSGSKASLRSFTKSWNMELAHLGIRATQLDFGNIQTGILDKTFPQIKETLEPNAFYVSKIDTIKKAAFNRSDRGMPSEKAAQFVAQIIEKPNPKVSYIVGRDAKIINFLHQLLPYSMFEQILTKRTGLRE